MQTSTDTPPRMMLPNHAGQKTLRGQARRLPPLLSVRKHRLRLWQHHGLVGIRWILVLGCDKMTLSYENVPRNSKTPEEAMF